MSGRITKNEETTTKEHSKKAEDGSNLEENCTSTSRHIRGQLGFPILEDKDLGSSMNSMYVPKF